MRPLFGRGHGVGVVHKSLVGITCGMSCMVMLLSAFPNFVCVAGTL